MPRTGTSGASETRCGGARLAQMPISHHGKADAARARIQIFGVLAPWLGLTTLTVNHLDRPDDKDFARVAARKDGVTLPEGNLRLIDLNC